jgi:hypothetical protein
MNIAVHFLGLCLFEQAEPSFITAWLPNAVTQKNHKDGKAGRVHTPYLQIAADAVTPNPKLPPVSAGWHNIPLDEDIVRLKIDWTGNEVPTSWQAYGVPDLRPCTMDLKFEGAPGEWIAKMVLRGGVFTSPAEGTSVAGAWEFNDSLRPGYFHRPPTVDGGVAWKLDGIDSMQIGVGGISATIAQPSSAKVCSVRIGNLCDPLDQWDDLRPEVCDTDVCEDEDFRWYYNLFTSIASGDIESRVLSHPSGSLPVPLFRKPPASPEGIFPTGCTQARW